MLKNLSLERPGVSKGGGLALSAPLAALLSDTPRAQVPTQGDWLVELIHASVASRIAYFLGGARK